MSDKKLAVIYFNPANNNDIIQSDYSDFYEALKDYNASKDNNILISHETCLDIPKLLDKIESLLEETKEELHLLFSGHGQSEGIPVGERLLENEDIAILLDHPKIKSCFFSSCQSAQLAQTVAKRKIPVVLGTLKQADIHNSFAIKFQKLFYQNLLDKLSFKKAFEQAYLKIKSEDDSKATKGFIVTRGLSLEEIEPRVINDYQIIFQDLEEEKEELHLVYPNIEEEINADVKRWEEQGKEMQIVIVYAANENIQKSFEQSFNRRGWDNFCKLYLLSQEDLEVLAKVETPRLFINFLKIIFIIDNKSNDIFLNPHLNKVFNKEKHLTEENLEYALILKEGILVDELFESASDFKKEITKVKDRHFMLRNLEERSMEDSFLDLMNEDDFSNFIADFPVNLSLRKTFVLKFPCNPAKENIEQIQNPENNIITIIAPHSYEKLVNFLINWFIAEEEYSTPAIILNLGKNKEEDVFTVLKSSVSKMHPNVDSIERASNRKENFWILEELLYEGHIVVIKMDLPNLQACKKNIEEVIQEFKNVRIPGDAKKPTFFFFIINRNFQIPNLANYKNTLSQHLEFPEQIAVDQFKDWKGKIKFFDKKISPIIDEIKNEDVANKQPEQLISMICDLFLIPTNQILNI